MTAQASFAPGDAHVSPGEAIVLQLTVVNLGESTETFTLVPVGLAAGWTTIHPAVVTVLAGGEEVVEVDVHPPLLPTTSAGNTSLTIRIIPQSEPDEILNAETALIVSPLHDRRLTFLQPAQRARRRAVFEMMLENRGNSMASCRMRLAGGAGRITADFDPPSVGLEPGASAHVRAKVQANSWQWDRRSRTLNFRVEADQQGGPVAVASGTFVQAPVLPERLWGRLLATLAVAGLAAAAWFAVVRPEIRDAADRAVAERSPALGATTTSDLATDDTTAPAAGGTGNGIAPGGPVVTATSAPTEPPIITAETTPATSPSVGGAGSLITQRLRADVLNGQTGQAEFVAPDGGPTRITDLILQNSNNDFGVATVLRDDQIVSELRLENIQTQIPMQLVSPVELLPGQRIIFQVACTAPGGPGGTCTPGLLLSGRHLTP